MRWQVEWGRKSAWLRDLARETGEMPPALTREPEIPPDLEHIILAFNRLTGSRQIGLSMGPIAMSEIKAYVELFPIPDDIETFVYLIREMDNEYLSVIEKQAPNGNSTSTGS